MASGGVVFSAPKTLPNEAGGTGRRTGRLLIPAGKCKLKWFQSFTECWKRRLYTIQKQVLIDSPNSARPNITVL
ncbi:hypothetical protein chiPu_0013044 [Chiloscyllium punctatum]|uniref:Uncharacterized protein n=1 Tax=Chiloscyllium punctatum TaxID=137246 RepID=A0A401SVZ0_CHIPU|nr:hypothetical protein [Chiloscyllium punctatum]